MGLDKITAKLHTQFLLNKKKASEAVYVLQNAKKEGHMPETREELLKVVEKKREGEQND